MSWLKTAQKRTFQKIEKKMTIAKHNVVHRCIEFKTLDSIKRQHTRKLHQNINQQIQKKMQSKHHQKGITILFQELETQCSCYLWI